MYWPSLRHALRHKFSDTGLKADRATVDRVLDRVEQERHGGRYLMGEAFTVADLAAAAMLSPLLRPPEIQYPVRVELSQASAELQCHAATASDRAVGGRDLSTASGPLRGTHAAIS
jgi:glutathione S-transferase